MRADAETALRAAPPPFACGERSPSPSRARGGLRFAGYAAVFDRVDRGGDVVRRGAFARAAKDVPLLWEHGGAPIGEARVLGEDSRGLRVIGRIAEAKAAALVKRGGMNGLSFGYRVRAAKAGAARELTELELIEVSLVASPMQPLARVHAVEG